MDNLIQFLVNNGYAENGISAAHIVKGLYLDGLDEIDVLARVRLYRLWRPNKKSSVKPYQAYDLVLQTGLNPEDYPDLQKQCHHPIVAIMDGKCGICADATRAEQYKEGVQI